MRSWQLISLKRWLTCKQNWKQFVRSLAAPEHDQIKKTWRSTHVSPGATCFEQFRSITLIHHYDSKKGPAIMGRPSTIFQSCVQVGFLRISPWGFQSKSPLTCRPQTCLQRMSNTLHIIEIWNKFVGTKAKDTEDWEVKTTWQSRCKTVLQ